VRRTRAEVGVEGGVSRCVLTKKKIGKGPSMEPGKREVKRTRIVYSGNKKKKQKLKRGGEKNTLQKMHPQNKTKNKTKKNEKKKKKKKKKKKERRGKRGT